LKGGELIRKGEEELYNLGIRIRERFPELFEEEYHPDVYPIKASQVSSVLKYSTRKIVFSICFLDFKSERLLSPINPNFIPVLFL
jgi:multiple inositol-polyphosphate phosphatase/2,3-bisphosphoglycerate 3-phosphatase